MIPPRPVLPLVACCLLLLPPCLGAAMMSPEAATAKALAEWTRMCAESNGGQAPGSWSEYRAPLKLSMDDVFAPTVPTKRYAVLADPIRLAPPLNGALLIINRSAIYDTTPSTSVLDPCANLKGPGRYIVYRTPDGHFESSWVSEDYVRDTFTAAKMGLPESDGEPERPWVAQARSGRIWYWGTLTAVLLFVAGLGYAFKRTAAKASILGTQVPSLL